MQKTDYQTLGDVLRQAVSDSGMEDRLRETHAAALWNVTVGQTIASQCGKPWVASGILNVAVRNAALRQELSMTRSSLVKAINSNFDHPVIKDIRLLG